MEIDNTLLFVVAIFLIFAYMYYTKISDENRRYSFVIDNFIDSENRSSNKKKSSRKSGSEDLDNGKPTPRQYNPVVFD
jgi:hypothetical protein